MSNKLACELPNSIEMWGPKSVIITQNRRMNSGCTDIYVSIVTPQKKPKCVPHWHKTISKTTFIVCINICEFVFNICIDSIIWNGMEWNAFGLYSCKNTAKIQFTVSYKMQNHKLHTLQFIHIGFSIIIIVHTSISRPLILGTHTHTN